MSSYRDENRPSTLVAFSVSGSGGGPALEATTRAVQAAVALHQGRIVRPSSGAQAGVADFRSAERAFVFAAETLGMAARFNERHADAPMDLRLGIHHDTVWFVGEEAIGDALAVAAHLAGMAAPGAVCASAEAVAELEDASAWELAERGSATVPGVDRKIGALDLRPRGGAGAQASRLVSGQAPQSRPATASGQEGPRRVSLDQAERVARPAWMDAPLPPSPPSARTAGAEIVAGLVEIGKAVAKELEARSKGDAGEKVRSAIERSAARWEETRRSDHGHAETADEESYADEVDGGPPAELPAGKLERRKKRLAARAGKAVAGFVSHLTTYALVGGGIVALNLFTSPGFPWAFFPVAGWGIGVFCHLRSVLSARRKARQMRALEAVSAEQLALVEKLQRVESSFAGHTAAYLAVNGYLAGINLITSPAFLWFLFPAAAWGIGFAIHWTGHLARRASLSRRLADAGLSWRDLSVGKKVSGGHAALGSPTRVAPDMEFFDLVRDARGIRDGLLREVSAHEAVASRMGSDVTELLTTYSDQLETLVVRNDEFRKTLESLPEAELEREIADYRSRDAESEPDTLRLEYRKAAEQAERQLKSVRELQHQKEILGVRIRSAFGLLKQLELDFVRLKNAATSDDAKGLASIRSKAHEISDYLEGLDEVEGEK